MDRIYGLPYTRRPHPSYREPIPAFEMIKIRSRSCAAVSAAARSVRSPPTRDASSNRAARNRCWPKSAQMAADPTFKGVVSDIGGPTANMYQMQCTRPEVEAICRRQSCVHPDDLQAAGHRPRAAVQLMREAREVPGIKKVLVASGIRMDLARRSPEYMRELARHHVGGHLKVAPEHVDPEVLDLMRKPSNDDFEQFGEAFRGESQRRARSNIWCPTSSPAIRAAIWMR